jgi:hypothetical protein
MEDKVSVGHGRGYKSIQEDIGGYRMYEDKRCKRIRGYTRREEMM